MRLSGHKNKHFIISILLLMIFAQSFSMHFHFTDGDSEHSHQVHAHSLDSLHDDHVTTDHEEESSTDILGTLAKKSHSFDLLVVILLCLFPVALSKSHTWRRNRKHRPLHYLLFFRPPLRAPPV